MINYTIINKNSCHIVVSILDSDSKNTGSNPVKNVFFNIYIFNLFF